jgi:hypothetical protein
MTPEWYDEQARGRVGAMGQRETDFARDVYEQRMGGQDSVAIAARMQQLGDVRRRAAMAGAMGPLAARQGMFRGGDEAIGRLTSTAGAHQQEIEQARQAAAAAYGRRSDYELMQQKLRQQRGLAGEAAWQQREARREAMGAASEQRTEDYALGLAGSATSGMAAAGKG